MKELTIGYVGKNLARYLNVEPPKAKDHDLLFRPFIVAYEYRHFLKSPFLLLYIVDEIEKEKERKKLAEPMEIQQKIALEKAGITTEKEKSSYDLAFNLEMKLESFYYNLRDGRLDEKYQSEVIVEEERILMSKSFFEKSIEELIQMAGEDILSLDNFERKLKIYSKREKSLRNYSDWYYETGYYQLKQFSKKAKDWFVEEIYKSLETDEEVVFGEDQEIFGNRCPKVKMGLKEDKICLEIFYEKVN